jgi:hypothetical protein
MRAPTRLNSYDIDDARIMVAMAGGAPVGRTKSNESRPLA